MNPNTLQADGTCPECGRLVEEPKPAGEVLAERDRAPWHFKLLMVLLALYLIWRIVDLFL